MSSERLLAPLGMADTHFSLPLEKEARRVVIHGLDAKTKGWDQPTRYVSASGGLSSTARDYLRFEQMLANGGTLFGNRILSPLSVATMTRNQVGKLFGQKGNRKAGGSATPWRSCWTRPSRRAAAAKGRSAGAGAFGTTTWTDPELEIAAVLMVQQGSQGVVQDFSNAIRAAIID